VAAAGSGLAVVDGQMVDDVHVRLARQVLARRAPATDTHEEHAQ
jgi:citrate lyase beta subunit